MRPSGESTHGTGSLDRVVRGRPTDEGKFVETSFLAVGPVGRLYFFVVGGEKFQLLPGMPFEHVPTIRTLPFESTRCGR